MIVVADASPLILLGSIGQLVLLQHLFHQVVVPQSVWVEVTGDLTRPGARVVGGAGWLLRHEDPSAEPTLAHLGRGESMAIALARQLRADLVLVDDLQGRRAARRIGVQVRGTLGVVVAAKRAGMVPAVRPVIEELVRNGMRISDGVVAHVLDAAGE